MFYWLRPQAMFYIPHVGTSVGAKPLRVSHLYRIVCPLCKTPYEIVKF